MATVEEVRVHDALPVHSRVSWGGIFCGAAVGLAIYCLLVALGVALGLTVSEEGTLGTGTGIYAMVIGLVSLFVGGWVTSQFTVGESKFEAMVYGVVLWAVVFMGLSALSVIGLTKVNMISQFAGAKEKETAAATVKAQPGGQQMQQEQGGPAQTQAEKKELTAVAWYGFLGILVSMAA